MKEQDKDYKDLIEIATRLAERYGIKYEIDSDKPHSFIDENGNETPINFDDPNWHKSIFPDLNPLKTSSE